MSDSLSDRQSIGLDLVHADLEAENQASQQLLLDLQQAVTESASDTNMSRLKPARNKAASSHTSSERALKKRKISSTKDENGSGEGALHGHLASTLDEDAEMPGSPDELALPVSKLSAQGSSLIGRSTLQSKLKRFGSEEPSDDAPTEATLKSTIELQSEGSDDSDDNAPEEAMVGATEDRVGAAEVKAAKAQARDQETRRARRREHSRRMKEQATLSKKSTATAPSKEDEHEDKSGDARNHDLPAAVTRDPSNPSALPTLLPEDLLAREFTPHFSIPSKQYFDRDVKKQDQKSLLDKRDRPPKDIIHGNTRIRVLPQQPSSLPPKSESKGKALREAWLLGHRGNNQDVWTPRAKEFTGFVQNPKKKRKHLR